MLAQFELQVSFKEWNFDLQKDRNRTYVNLKHGDGGLRRLSKECISEVFILLSAINLLRIASVTFRCPITISIQVHAFFYKEPVYKEPTCRRPKYLKNLYY